MKYARAQPTVDYIALSSLPGSIKFYKALGFKDSDPKKKKPRKLPYKSITSESGSLRGTPAASPGAPTTSPPGCYPPDDLLSWEGSGSVREAPLSSVASSLSEDESEYVEGQIYMTYPLKKRK